MTRYLVPAFLVGLTTTLFANDTYGWLAAGVTVALMALVHKVRGTAPACAISARTANAQPATAHDADARLP